MGMSPDSAHLRHVRQKAVWQSGSLAVWQYGSMAVWQYGMMALSLQFITIDTQFLPRKRDYGHLRHVLYVLHVLHVPSSCSSAKSAHEKVSQIDFFFEN